MVDEHVTDYLTDTLNPRCVVTVRTLARVVTRLIDTGGETVTLVGFIRTFICQGINGKES